jgi:hypothetical protein
LYKLYSFLTNPQHKLTTPSSSYQERRRKSTTPFSFSQAPNMELAPSFFNGSWKRYWRRKRYQRLDGAITARKNTNVARFGGSPRRTWKIKAVPKLRILKNIASPTKLLRKLKNAYISMILSVAGNADGTHVFGDKRVPRGRQAKAILTRVKLLRNDWSMRFIRICLRLENYLQCRVIFKWKPTSNSFNIYFVYPYFLKVDKK